MITKPMIADSATPTWVAMMPLRVALSLIDAVPLVDAIVNDTLIGAVVISEGRGVGEWVGWKLCPAAKHEVAPSPLPVVQRTQAN